MSVTTRSGARLQASGSAALPPAAGHRGQRPSPRQQAHHKPSPNSAAACLVLVSLCALAGCCALLLGRQRLGRPSAVPPVGARQTTTHRHHHSHTSCPPGEARCLSALQFLLLQLEGKAKRRSLGLPSLVRTAFKAWLWNTLLCTLVCPHACVLSPSQQLLRLAGAS